MDTMEQTTKTERLNTRMTPLEREMFRILADEDGLSEASLQRLLVRREWANRRGRVPKSLEELRLQESQREA